MDATIFLLGRLHFSKNFNVIWHEPVSLVISHTSVVSVTYNLQLSFVLSDPFPLGKIALPNNLNILLASLLHTNIL